MTQIYESHMTHLTPTSSPVEVGSGYKSRRSFAEAFAMRDPFQNPDLRGNNTRNFRAMFIGTLLRIQGF